MNELQQLSKNLAEVVQMAGASVVVVDARKRITASGTVVSADAVLTASHVVEREENIQVLQADGNKIAAKFAGRDSGSDLALLKLDRPVLTVSTPVKGQAKVGQLALALGRPSPENLQASLGIISAVAGPVRTERGSMLDYYYRTDAVPYPGFSGGPLVDMDGHILGINTSGFTPGSSLVIPADLAWQVADSLSRLGRVRRGYLGIRSQPVDLPQRVKMLLRRDQTSGLLLVGVEEGSPAEKVGMMIGDILVDLAGKPVTDHDALMTLLGSDLVGQSVPIEVLRGGVPQVFEIKINEKE
jgi:S1-C subfamily serine protease